MIETNFQRLMRQSADLLSEIKPGKSHNNSAEKYTDFVSETGRPIPVRHFYQCFQLLVDEPDTFKCEAVIISLYEPAAVPNISPVGTTILVHGHDPDSHCQTSTYCHVLGYKGTTPNWMKKWGALTYVTSVSNQSSPNNLE
jgi:hypothetical protein